MSKKVRKIVLTGISIMLAVVAFLILPRITREDF